MHTGKTRLLAGGAGARFDDGDAGEDVAAIGGASSYIAVADPYAGDVGDGIERAGLQLADRDVQVTGAWFHGFLIFKSWQKKGCSGHHNPNVGAGLLAKT
ncbi:hypothetical protein D3C87_1452540 [compost metagenome]